LTAIAGVYQLDGRPVERPILDAIAQPLPGDTADSVDTWTDGPIGFACASAAALGRRLLRDDETGVVVALDGRFDNGGAGDGDADPAGVLNAYLESGDVAIDRLLGDFALAVWDPRGEGRLLLAVDPMAARPLYVHAPGGTVLFASTLEQLLRALPRQPEIDEEMAVAYLYRPLLPYPRTTNYRGVDALRGSERRAFAPSASTAWTHSRWPESPPERRTMRGDEPDEFRALLEEAVRCRLRSASPVGILLSGGLDSGAVGAVAGELRASDPSIDLRAYTHAFDRFTGADERRFAIAVADGYGLPHTLVKCDECWTLSTLEPWLSVFTEPMFGPYDALFYRSLSTAFADGVRTMLTGHGGDVLFMGSATYFAWWLVGGQWRALHEQVSRKRRTGRWGYGYQFAAWALYPLLPRSVLGAVFQRQRSLDPMKGWMPDHVQQRYREWSPRVQAGGPAGWWHNLRDDVDVLTSTPHTRFFDRLTRRFGLELRNPLLDARLVEFALRAPPDVFFRDGLSRWVVSEALRDVLPPIVRDRTDKTPSAPLMQYGLREARRGFVQRLLVDAEVVRRGYVLERPWRASVERYLAGSDREPIWQSLSTELWLRHLEGRLPPLE
jgi:asparagine synthase (glutamine-hydrolysing)